MRARTVHRVVGIILLIPFFGWALTGLVFFIKPGYAGAYELLSPKTYPLNTQPPIGPAPGWQEFRCISTILGDHLLVRTRSGWIHLDPKNNQPRNPPNDEDLRKLLKDAFSVNPTRYGDIIGKWKHCYDEHRRRSHTRLESNDTSTKGERHRSD